MDDTFDDEVLPESSGSHKARALEREVLQLRHERAQMLAFQREMEDALLRADMEAKTTGERAQALDRELQRQRQVASEATVSRDELESELQTIQRQLEELKVLRSQRAKANRARTLSMNSTNSTPSAAEGITVTPPAAESDPSTAPTEHNLNDIHAKLVKNDSGLTNTSGDTEKVQNAGSKFDMNRSAVEKKLEAEELSNVDENKAISPEVLEKFEAQIAEQMEEKFRVELEERMASLEQAHLDKLDELEQLLLQEREATKEFEKDKEIGIVSSCSGDVLSSVVEQLSPDVALDVAIENAVDPNKANDIAGTPSIGSAAELVDESDCEVDNGGMSAIDEVLVMAVLEDNPSTMEELLSIFIDDLGPQDGINSEIKIRKWLQKQLRPILFNLEAKGVLHVRIDENGNEPKCVFYLVPVSPNKSWFF